MALLVMKDLCVKYGQVTAIHRANLSVAQGEAVALLGVNGAGKSTLLLTAAGILPVSGGTVFFRGEDITAAPAPVRVRLGLALAPEGRRVFGLMTVEENLLAGAHARGGEPYTELEKAYEMFPVLHEKRRSPAGSLSGGQQQMLSIARALMSRPVLLMLDEPTMGLSPALCGEVYRFIAAARGKGLTVLVSGEDAKGLRAACDRAVLMTNGVLS